MASGTARTRFTWDQPAILSAWKDIWSLLVMSRLIIARKTACSEVGRMIQQKSAARRTTVLFQSQIRRESGFLGAQMRKIRKWASSLKVKSYYQHNLFTFARRKLRTPLPTRLRTSLSSADCLHRRRVEPAEGVDRSIHRSYRRYRRNCMQEDP